MGQMLGLRPGHLRQNERDGLVTETTHHPPSAATRLDCESKEPACEAAVKDDKFLLRMCSGGVHLSVLAFGKRSKLLGCDPSIHGFEPHTPPHTIRASGETGRHTPLRGEAPQGGLGSSPSLRTKQQARLAESVDAPASEAGFCRFESYGGHQMGRHTRRAGATRAYTPSPRFFRGVIT